MINCCSIQVRSGTRRPIGLILAAISAIVTLLAGAATAQVPADSAVQISVQTQTNPPSITLNWNQRLSPVSYTVYRRVDFNSPWTLLTTPSSLPGTVLTYTDTNVVVGGRYEYKVVRTVLPTPPTYIFATGYGYVCAGIQAPLVENRGKVILMVDGSMTTPLQSELSRLVGDLVGDGWTVIRHDVPRNSTNASVKALIVADYQADPANVKSVLLFGHIPFFMSGNMAPDGHNPRPWPTDQYYGDVDGTWTEYSTTVQPGNLELQIGRVDLWNLPTFTKSETELLRQYLNKDHNYRYKTYPIVMKGFVCDNLGELGSEAPAQNGYRNFAPFFGGANVIDLVWMSGIKVPYLWAYGCGAGNYDGCNGVLGTIDISRGSDAAIFTFMFGSFFGQYDAADDLMRAELGSNNYGLTCIWGARPNAFVHHMALGETIGLSTMLTQNQGGSMYNGYQGCQMNLMGDPTLRTFMIAPPSALAVSPNSFGEVDLSWTASADTVLGYYVYRSAQSGGPFARITPSIVSATQFHDSNPAVGTNYYMVRAIVLQSNPSGSYYDASQGAIAGCNVASVNRVSTIIAAKWLADSTLVYVTSGKVVTVGSSVFADGACYIEEPDRSSGIRITGAVLGSVTPGSTLTVAGDIETSPDGERYINVTSASTVGTGSVGPLLLTNNSLGGGPYGFDAVSGTGQRGIQGAVGLCNLGLLVRACGKFTYVDSHTFLIDDGSGVNVKCVVPDGVLLNQDSIYVGVTGISSCETVGGEQHRLLRVRDQSDIVGY